VAGSGEGFYGMSAILKSCAVLATSAFVVIAASGCGGQAAPVDSAPFRQAIAEYLESKNMAMTLKEIKEGPVVDEDTARLTASLSHKDLGGPSVTWTFDFKRDQSGKWCVLRHED